jgi:ribA/ribD-fused uncharacterized protein
MEALIPQGVVANIREFVFIASRDTNAELEIKVLSGQIQTKDVADRLVKAIEDITTGGATEEHRASFSYSDGLRVNVLGAETIHKVCTTNSFRNIPLTVERKRKYFDVGTSTVEHKVQDDVIDIPDLRLRFTLRHEEQLRKDFSGSPMDPANHIRILHRKSWKTADGLLRIDFSMTKSKSKTNKTFADILKQPPTYELEIEVIDRNADEKKIVESMFRHAAALLAAYQNSPFLLTEAEKTRYQLEFERMKMHFVNPVTMERRHIISDRPHNVLTGYTVTNKADGERSFLVVAQDKRLLRITPSGKITWTGITSTKDSHVGDILDGEYLSDRNLFCIFDVYRFRGKATERLPLMTSDDDVLKDPLKSRLGCAHLFVDDLRKDFTAAFSAKPFRIETKLFLAGNGPMMEKAINTLLDTKFEYPTDGLIFTPRASGVAPPQDRKGDVWLRVYKWKPADQNSIDFLVRFKPGDSYDPVLGQRVFRGTLYVSRSPGADIIYPCETITGEYKPPTLPADLQVIAETRDRVPSPFQPAAPKAPNANEILIPVNSKGIPIDETGARIEDNTIIECSRDTDRGRWNIMRTRYDKTFQYRVLGKPQFGNDTAVAESIWTNIHNPVTEQMIRQISSNPPSDTFEDELYFRDNLEARDRVMKDISAFHNKIKENYYHSSVKVGDTLLELAVGRANDLHKWRKTKPSKVVGVDLSASNIDAPKQGACVRYIQESKKSKLPPALFIVGDMSQPLLEQESHYFKILDKREPATTPYLEKFAGLTEFDVISCQFAIHYACETEESFRMFVGNLTRHGKGLFFGTCLDGQSVYSLLLGKQSHTFRADKQVFGEFTKEYADGSGWTEEFGKAILVKLESFEKAQREYLVPFEKVREILAENDYELVGSNLFSDEYASQTDNTLTQEQQSYSFLHRAFVFKRVPKKPEPEEKQEVEIPVMEEDEKSSEADREEKKEDEKSSEADREEKKEEKDKSSEAERKPKAKRVTIKVKTSAEPLPEPVFFFSGNPALNDNKYLSNMHDAPMQINGITFPTVEHYFQWSKANLFGDKEMETKILKTTSPKSVKTYGKKVKDFKEDVWAEKKDDIMRTALKAKFVQHPDLRAKLLETGTRPIAEADPRDKYWAIGTSADTSKAKDPAKWPGKNVLGKMLETLRTELNA